MITGIVSSASNTVLSWPSVDGRFYRIYCSTNLMDPEDWVQVYGEGDTSPVNVFTNSVSSNAAAYYRLSVELD